MVMFPGAVPLTLAVEPGGAVRTGAAYTMGPVPPVAAGKAKVSVVVPDAAYWAGGFAPATSGGAGVPPPVRNVYPYP